MAGDTRIDEYIARKAAFAQPILRHLRAQVAKASPDAQETIKWSSPAWTYKGELLCSMAAFKAHAAFGFWRGAEVTGEADVKDAMGSFGRITSLADLPDDAALRALIQKAMALIDSGVKAPRVLKHPKPELTPPPQFQSALDANPAAAAHFAAFPPGQRRDYLEWIIDAKREETRDRRIAQAIEWIGEGKIRNWKYMNC